MNTAKNLDYEEEKAKTTGVAEKPQSRKYITTMEEYLSIPEEVREKAITEMKYVFDNARTLFPIAVKKALRAQLERGTPISYSDGNGKVLRRYPDGKIFLADIDLETFEKNEVFLRMATPEDDIGIYGERDRIAELAETEEIKELRKLYREENEMAYKGEDISSFIITLSGVCDQKIYEGKEAAVYFEILDTRDFLLEKYSELTDIESLRYKKDVADAVQEADDKLLFFVNKIF